MIHQYILDILNLLPKQEKQFLYKSDKGTSLIIADKNLFTITPETLFLADTMHLEEKLKMVTPEIKNTLPSLEKLKQFFQTIDPHFVRLNHVGISYFCNDIQKEIDTYKKALQNTNFKLYEEDANDPKQKWFFVGNISDWEAPLVEIVLNISQTPEYIEWVPHFQIDIDTILSMKELENLSRKHFGDHFWKWKLDIPDYGVVLAMAIVGEINGIKVTLGVGTKLRGTQYHREHILKLLNS